MMKRRTFVGGLGALSLSSAIFLDRARAQSGAPIVVKGAYAAPGLSFAAIFLANRIGLWAKNGISTQLKQVQGDPMSMVALTNQEANFAGTASTAPIIGWSKDIKTLSIGAFTGSLVAQYTARKDWLSRVGVAPTLSAYVEVDLLAGLAGCLADVATAA